MQPLAQLRFYILQLSRHAPAHGSPYHRELARREVAPALCVKPRKWKSPVCPPHALLRSRPRTARTRSAVSFSGCSSNPNFRSRSRNCSRNAPLRPGVETPRHKVSRPGESHPEPLSEPYLNLSAHTAPAMEPRRTPICQCAHNFGSRLEIRATQCVALRKWPRSFLYFRSAQRANDRSSCRIGG